MAFSIVKQPAYQQHFIRLQRISHSCDACGVYNNRIFPWFRTGLFKISCISSMQACSTYLGVNTNHLENKGHHHRPYYYGLLGLQLLCRLAWSNNFPLNNRNLETWSLRAFWSNGFTTANLDTCLDNLTRKCFQSPNIVLHLITEN